MANQMTSHERIARMYAHKEADRVPVWDSPWESTIDRWVREGMPTRDYVSYFNLDKTAMIYTDNSPRYPSSILEETDEYYIEKTPWGVTLRNWKKHGSTPEFIDFTITDAEKWLDAKKRMTFDRSRVDWNWLKESYPIWKKEDRWISAQMWFGFDVTHSWMVGTERFLMALIEDPDWCRDMYDTHLKLDMQLLDAVWDEGYRFDEVFWYDDMGYKNNQFFSLNTYRQMDKPYHKIAADWAHNKGAKVRMHSCGDIHPFIPDLVELGIDALNPLEVKAGMDGQAIKKQFGDQLVLHGGIDAQYWSRPDIIVKQIEELVPVFKQNGGYIFSSDHSIPEDVSLEDFKKVLAALMRVGTY